MPRCQMLPWCVHGPGHACCMFCFQAAVHNEGGPGTGLWAAASRNWCMQQGSNGSEGLRQIYNDCVRGGSRLLGGYSPSNRCSLAGLLAPGTGPASNLHSTRMPLEVFLTLPFCMRQPFGQLLGIETTTGTGRIQQQYTSKDYSTLMKTDSGCPL